MGIAMGNLSVNNMKRNFSTELLQRANKEEAEEDDEWVSNCFKVLSRMNILNDVNDH